MRKEGDQCESIAVGETLVASIKMVASKVVGRSPLISDIFEDKAKVVGKGPHYLVLGHEMEKEGLSGGRENNVTVKRTD